MDINKIYRGAHASLKPRWKTFCKALVILQLHGLALPPLELLHLLFPQRPGAARRQRRLRAPLPGLQPLGQVVVLRPRCPALQRPQQRRLRQGHGPILQRVARLSSDSNRLGAREPHVQVILIELVQLLTSFPLLCFSMRKHALSIFIINHLPPHLNRLLLQGGAARLSKAHHTALQSLLVAPPWSELFRQAGQLRQQDARILSTLLLYHEEIALWRRQKSQAALPKLFAHAIEGQSR